MNRTVKKILIGLLLLGFISFIIYFIACVVMDKCDNYESCGQPGDNINDHNQFDDRPALCCDGRDAIADSKGTMRCP